MDGADAGTRVRTGDGVRLVLGLDLSGPTNTTDTALALVSVSNGSRHLANCRSGVTDAEIVQTLRERSPDVVAIDAPLSYNPGGGDRPGDRALRGVASDLGLPSGTVMTPTMSRMVYLTLRGVVVARLVREVSPRSSIVETHPAAALALRGADVAEIRSLKSSASSRSTLVQWMNDEIKAVEDRRYSDHEVAALAAAMAGWDWSQGRSRWLFPADGLHHPFDFAA